MHAHTPRQPNKQTNKTKQTFVALQTFLFLFYYLFIYLFIKMDKMGLQLYGGGGFGTGEEGGNGAQAAGGVLFLVKEGLELLPCFGELLLLLLVLLVAFVHRVCCRARRGLVVTTGFLFARELNFLAAQFITKNE
jgi:hypothetical protein